MKKLFAIYIILALTGCTAGNDEPDFGIDPGTAISFFTGVDRSITTRAPIQFPETGNIGPVQILRKDGGSISEISSSTTTANIKNTGPAPYPMIPTDDQYFIPSQPRVYFRAYYPAGPLDGNIVKYEINGTQDIITSDEPVAKYDVVGGDKIEFKFEHQLARIKLQIEVENQGEADAFDTITSATIKDIPVNLELKIDDGGNFDLSKSSTLTNEIELSFLAEIDGGKKKLEYSQEDQGIQEIGNLMIYPQTAITEIYLGFTNKDEQKYELTWKDIITGNPITTFEAGKMYTITATLKAFEIRFNVSVDPWIKGNGENGEDIIIGGNTEEEETTP